ncbi:hypothetical protein DFA_10479 [Cavenderia fasciculata]|uniref:Uncharacterized protein n=1 Tax=Cavenderia fasciculata TaxID=261658 RepID=F4QAB8_CACFS|nr:uncharacterized protein DFA_10479 [Cavenderia fasciculata]EGG15637.1 hypothetical protein DFA_10479 [Cavenderia fasciculata]|eukprot:XP_004354379.1 hypothetical protein DFA_10479 [Cavenderia fasciculata]
MESQQTATGTRIRTEFFEKFMLKHLAMVPQGLVPQSKCSVRARPKQQEGVFYFTYYENALLAGWDGF